MTVAITGGPLRKRIGWAEETLTQSTATAFQAVSLEADVSILGAGTASGFALNRYSLANGTEGQEKIITLNATGEAKCLPLAATATAMWVLSSADDFLALRFFRSRWHVISSAGATLASTT